MAYTNIILIVARYYCLSGAICGTYKEFSYINQFRSQKQISKPRQVDLCNGPGKQFATLLSIPRIEFANDSLKKLMVYNHTSRKQRTINMQISLPGITLDFLAHFSCNAYKIQMQERI